jgi:hypothetical protein
MKHVTLFTYCITILTWLRIMLLGSEIQDFPDWLYFLNELVFLSNCRFLAVGCWVLVLLVVCVCRCWLCCWLLAVGCRVLTSVCRMSLLVVVVCPWLSGVANDGCCLSWLSGVAVDGCAADFSLLNLPKGKSLGRSKPATNS